MSSSSHPFKKEFIEELAKMIADCDLSEIEIEHDKSRLRVAREVKQHVYAPVQTMPTHMPTQATPVPHTPAAPPAAPTEVTPPAIDGETVTSPMVGTVYLSPEPGASAFIKEGDKVKKGQTIMIVEAMKVMNNIPSPISGTVKSIKVLDKDPVEFGQPLVIIG